MTATVQDAPAPAPASEEPTGPKRPYLQAVMDSTTTTVIVAIFIALCIAAILVVAADPASQKAFGYVTARPQDFFQRRLGRDLLDVLGPLPRRDLRLPGRPAPAGSGRSPRRWCRRCR